MGAQGTANFLASELEPEYGDYPLSYALYLKVRPGSMR
jgi:hypothetical protein